jgi:hypothetical protein
MQSAITKWRLPARDPLVIPVVEPLEARTLLTAATPAAAVAAGGPNRATFAVSDIFGAAAGFPIWQNGQAILPGSASPTNGSSPASPLTSTDNSALVASVTMPGGPGIFSWLPVLTAEGLAAVVLGALDPAQSASSAIFTSGYRPKAGSSAVNGQSR